MKEWGKGVQIPWDKLHFTIFTHAQKVSSKKSNIPPNLSHIDSLYSKSYCNIFFYTSFLFFFFYFFSFTQSSFHSFFFDLGVQTFFSQPLFPFPHCIYNIHSPLITTPILTIMKCQLSQDQGSSWFFGLKGLSPMWGSKENYHGFSL